MSSANFTLDRVAGYFYTYLHRRGDTGEIFYIGKGRGRRALSKSGRSDWWRRVVAKHGFTIDVVAPWSTEAAAFEHEIFLISTLRIMGMELVNLTDGGEGVALSDPAAIQRRIDALRAAKSTREHRELTSRRMRVERNTAAAKAKQSADTAQSWADPEARARRIESLRAAAAKPEARARLTMISRMRVSDPAQRAASAAHLKAMNASKAKPVVCITTGQEFASCTEAAAALGLKKCGVKEVCLGYYTQTRGLKFAFKHPGAEVPSSQN